MKLLSKGNKKLPTSTLIFNLPAVKTCPNSTPQCRKWCYARKAERMYPNVLPFRNRNHETSKQIDFVSLIHSELGRSRTVKQVRIHESGDFYSEEYYNKWLSIARLNKDLTFYAYTKVVTLGTIKRPDNFILILSDDDKLLKGQWHYFEGVATVTPKGAATDKSFFTCPGSCKTCDYCYNPTVNKRVTFEVH